MNGVVYKKDLINALTGVELDEESPLYQFLEALKESLLPPKQELLPARYRMNYNSPRLEPLKSLLRESLLTHQWEEAKQVLLAAATEKEGMNEATWKGGLETLLSDPDANRNHIDELNMQVSKLRVFETDEVDINQLLYLLADGRLERALHLDIKGRRRFVARTDDLQLDLLAEGYKGLVFFIKWLQKKACLEETDQSLRQGATGDSGKDMILTSMQHFKAFASIPFNLVIKHVGAWDVFVTAYIQMLEFHEEIEEGENFLQEYCDRNPSNPNAHRYLYEFVCKHNRSQDRKLTILQGLICCDPSNSLATDLFDLLLNSGDPQAVSVLFDMLDFECWQQSRQPWKKFASALKKIRNRGQRDAEKVVEECWQSRREWWPLFHFCPDGLAQAGSSRLLKHKAAAAALLLGEGNSYSQVVQEHLSQLSSSPPKQSGNLDSSLGTASPAPLGNT